MGSVRVFDQCVHGPMASKSTEKLDPQTQRPPQRTQDTRGGGCDPAPGLKPSLMGGAEKLYPSFTRGSELYESFSEPLIRVN